MIDKINNKLSDKVRLTEVLLREDVQNVSSEFLHHISPDSLIEIFNDLRFAGINSFEIASMVNPKRIPAMHPDRLKPIIFAAGVANDHLELITLVPNIRGLNSFFSMGLGNDGYKHTVGIFFSPYDEVNQRNVGKKTLDLVGPSGEYEKMFSRIKEDGSPVIAYLMNALGHKVSSNKQFKTSNNYIAQPSTKVLIKYINYLSENGVSRISLSDTEGLRNKEETKRILGDVISKVSNPEILAYHPHHSNPEQAAINIAGAYELGFRHFDTTSGRGYGGCIIDKSIANAGTKDTIKHIKEAGGTTDISLERLRLSTLKISEVYKQISKQ